MIVTSLSALADSVRSTLAGGASSATRRVRIEQRDNRPTNRIEDVFAPVDRNHDGAIQTSELTSALPKPAQQPEQRQSCSPTQTATGAPATIRFEPGMPTYTR